MEILGLYKTEGFLDVLYHSMEKKNTILCNLLKENFYFNLIIMYRYIHVYHTTYEGYWSDYWCLGATSGK